MFPVTVPGAGIPLMEELPLSAALIAAGGSTQSAKEVIAAILPSEHSVIM